jgi:hypothetical protein
MRKKIYGTIWKRFRKCLTGAIQQCVIIFIDAAAGKTKVGRYIHHRISTDSLLY